jgi:hypothetical protein
MHVFLPRWTCVTPMDSRPLFHPTNRCNSDRIKAQRRAEKYKHRWLPLLGWWSAVSHTILFILQPGSILYSSPSWYMYVQNCKLFPFNSPIGQTMSNVQRIQAAHQRPTAPGPRSLATPTLVKPRTNRRKSDSSTISNIQGPSTKKQTRRGARLTSSPNPRPRPPRHATSASETGCGPFDGIVFTSCNRTSCIYSLTATIPLPDRQALPRPARFREGLGNDPDPHALRGVVAA